LKGVNLLYPETFKSNNPLACKGKCRIYPLIGSRAEVVTMSWFNSSGFSSFAKSAISQAQKSIDKVLDIKGEDGGGEATSKLVNTSKSQSTDEGYSRSQKYPHYMDNKNGDDFDDGIHNFGKYRKRGQEEDSFFSSYLGSDRHSTPKINPETNRKSISPSKSELEDSAKNARRSSRKKNENSGSLSTSNIEANSKTEQSQNKSKLQSSVKMSAKVKKDAELDKRKNDDSDLFGEFLANGAATTSKVTAAEAQALNSESVLDLEANANNDAKLAINAYGSEGMQVGSSDVNRNDNGDDNDSCENECSDYVAESKNVSSNYSKSCEEGYDEQNSVESAEVLSKSKEERKEEKQLDNFGDDSSSVQNTFEAEIDNCYNIAESIDISESFRDRNMTHTEKTVADVGIPSKNDSSEFGNGIEDVTCVNELKWEVVEDEKSDKSLLDNCDTSVLSHKESYELNAKPDFVGDYISEKYQQVSVDDKMDFPAETKEVDEDSEDSHAKSESIFKNETHKCSGQVEDSMNDDPSAQYMEVEESDFKASIDSVSNDEMSHDTRNEDSAENHLNKDNLHVIQKESRSIEDLTTGPDHNKSVEDLSVASQDTIKLQKEIKRLQEVVDFRESKMVALSKENIDLQEAVSILRNQLEQAQLVETGENEVIREMRDEFTMVVDELRIELNAAKKERDELKSNLEETTNRLTRKSEDLVEDYTRSIKEKEDQIAGLLAEGEALSKRELKSNNLLKKFRAKVKMLEEKSELDEKRMEEKDAELKKLKETLKDINEQDRILKEQSKSLELITDQQEDENSRLKDQLDDAEDKMKGMQTTLDSSYLEINRLSLEKANLESEIEEIKQLKTTKAEFESRILELEDQAKSRTLEHLEELNNLRLALTRTEQTSARREDSLKLEIKDLQHRLDGAESRNQELSQSIATASRPLLRQIENLQSSHQNQAQNWERIEKNLSERLATAQQELAHVTEKERSAVDFAMEMKSRVAGLESQVKTLREQKMELSSNLETLKEREKIVEESLKKERKSLETYQANYRKAFEELQNEKIYIEDQLNTERAKHEAELFRISNEHKVKGQISRENSSNVVQSPLSEGKTEADDPDAPPSLTRSRTSSSSSSSNLIDASNKHTSTAIMEKLQTQLRQKDGELRVHKEEIVSLQKTRASLAQELVSLSNLVEELQENMASYASMKKNYQEMESRYNAALQLYGEKVEEADELRMDLEDVKQMYKQQIQQLVGDR